LLVTFVELLFFVDPSVFAAPCITTVPPKEGKSLRSKAVLLLLPALVVVVVAVPLAVPPGAIVAVPDVDDDVSVATAALPKPFPRELDVLVNPPAPPSKRSDMPFVGFCWLLLVPPNMP